MEKRMRAAKHGRDEDKEGRGQEADKEGRDGEMEAAVEPPLAEKRGMKRSAMQTGMIPNAWHLTITIILEYYLSLNL